MLFELKTSTREPCDHICTSYLLQLTCWQVSTDTEGFPHRSFPSSSANVKVAKAASMLPPPPKPPQLAHQPPCDPQKHHSGGWDESHDGGHAGKGGDDNQGDEEVTGGHETHAVCKISMHVNVCIALARGYLVFITYKAPKGHKLISFCEKHSKT